MRSTEHLVLLRKLLQKSFLNLAVQPASVKLAVLSLERSQPEQSPCLQCLQCLTCPAGSWGSWAPCSWRSSLWCRARCRCRQRTSRSLPSWPWWPSPGDTAGPACPPDRRRMSSCPGQPLHTTHQTQNTQKHSSIFMFSLDWLNFFQCVVSFYGNFYAFFTCTKPIIWQRS